ncbi:MAG: 16S rRNA processing protein RimM [Cyanobacteria bacterium REEB65]|nr:16S rRNA processing protein RimM [Cyanobacteria bacterium REEB65]
MTDGRNYVTIGRVLRPHGLQGEVKVEPLTADLGRFARLRRVFAAGPDAQRIELEVSGARTVQGGVLLRFTAIDTPEAAAELRGCTLEVPRDEAILPPSGQTLFADVIGLTAREAGTGRAIGTVKAIVAAGNDLLEIAAANGDILVPWVPDLVGEIDLARGFVEIKVIPGLLEPQ